MALNITKQCNTEFCRIIQYQFYRIGDSLHAVNKLMFTGFISFVESSGSTTKPINNMGEDCRVTRKKRKASITPESPTKRQRGASKPTEVAVEPVTAKGTKRKARTEREIPRKRLRSHYNITGASEPSELAVVLTAHGTKRKASTLTETASKKLKGANNDTDTSTGEATKVSVEACAERLPETPRTTRRTSCCDPAPSSSGPSTSSQSNWSTSFSVNTSRGKLTV